MKKNSIHIIPLYLVLSLLSMAVVSAQETENTYQTRVEYQLQYKPVKKLGFSLTPEMRFNEAFNTDRFLLESRVEYELFKFLELGGSYRFISNPRDEKDTEYLHRVAFDATLKKKVNRWRFSLRGRYTDYTEDNSDGSFFRLKAKAKYNINNCKITPYFAAESFRNLYDSEWYKMRYSAGLGYPVFNNSSISIGYKLDYYLQEYTNKHILYVGYKMKF